MTNNIAVKPGRIGPLVYNPPKEVGGGNFMPAYGTGGFALYLDDPSQSTAPRPRQRLRQLSPKQALGVASQLDVWTAGAAGGYETRGVQAKNAVEWVEKIMADLPSVLQQAIDTADKRTGQLRILKAAVTGETE